MGTIDGLESGPGAGAMDRSIADLFAFCGSASACATVAACVARKPRRWRRSRAQRRNHEQATEFHTPADGDKKQAARAAPFSTGRRRRAPRKRHSEVPGEITGLMSQSPLHKQLFI